MDTLSIIGCGHLGRSLGRVWTKNQLLRVETVLNRSSQSAREAVSFLGQGRAVSDFSELASSDFIMISASDDAILACCERLALSKTLKPGVIVFHCSGSQPSSLLEPAKKGGALVASLHPLRSFADPMASADTFSGTPCGIEGDPAACEALSRLITGSGGSVFNLTPETKHFYHAGTVMMCNYLTVLIEAGLQCYEKAGISQKQGLELSKPILEETLANNFKLSPLGALTGPISRGDSQVVLKQFEALEGLNPQLSDLYKAAGLLALELSKKKGIASDEALEKMKMRFLRD